MQAFTELIPPTGVTHALVLPFVAADTENLVVAKTSLLQIFALKNVANNHAATVNTQRRSVLKLVLIAEFPLNGTVTSLGRVKILKSKSGGDALLVALRNAKLSLLEWDPTRYSISTISIHYYENDDLQRSPWTPPLDQCPSHLTVDPSSRCAILSFGIRNIAVVPFLQPGDDLVMEDYGHELDGPVMLPKLELQESLGGVNQSYQTPYAASFVLPLTTLDPGLRHPIALEFLHEYREPTFGILYSQLAVSSSLSMERKDLVCYAVFTLDLDQRASTTLLSITKLPSDLHTVLPLPLPAGGALLIGNNEIVHVDQAGKTNAIGVNEFAQLASSFPMVDRSDLALSLENCTAQELKNDTGDVLIATSCGDLVVLGFSLDGRTTTSLFLDVVTPDNRGSIVSARTTCLAPLGRGKMFLGSEVSDSLVISWSRHNATHKGDIDKDEFTEDNLESGSVIDGEELDDDLYSSSTGTRVSKRQGGLNVGRHEPDRFEVDDQLLGLGSMRDAVFGRSSAGTQYCLDIGPLDLVVAAGSDKSGSVAILKRGVTTTAIKSYAAPGTSSVWSIRAKHVMGDTQIDGSGQVEAFAQYLVKSGFRNDGEGESAALYMVQGELKSLEGTDFDPGAGATLNLGLIGNGTRIVQILGNALRVYDTKFGLTQIFPLCDEDSSEEGPQIIATSFGDPFVLIIRADMSVLLLKVDQSGDLEEYNENEILTSTKWLTGVLFRDTHRHFDQGAPSNNGPTTFLFMLSNEEKLHVIKLSETCERILVADGVSFLPPILSSDFTAKRSVAKEKINDIFVADLGHGFCSAPHLFIRTDTGNLALYSSFWCRANIVSDRASLKFVKIPVKISPSQSRLDTMNPHHSASLGCMQSSTTVNGSSFVVVPGTCPKLVVKTPHSNASVFALGQEFIRSVCGIHFDATTTGFAHIDADENLRLSALLTDWNYSLSNWIVKKLELHQEVDCLTYSDGTGTYILGTSRFQDFKLPSDDEIHPEWRDEELEFFPTVPQGTIQLLSPKNWEVIHCIPLQSAERALCIENISVSVSEETHERRDMIVVGTAITRGEDILSRGSICIFEVVDVVPDPESKDIARQLKLIAREDVKGAVTSITQVGGQGFFLAAQGQKCIVRGLSEDGRISPIAFIDMQCQVSVVKELSGTGMCLVGDLLKGLWFVGYSEEPYKLALFGKSTSDLEVLSAEFLPNRQQLYMIAGDGDCNLHVLQYDPEHPKSSKGDRLLHRSSFHVGHFTTKLMLLPQGRTPVRLPASEGMDVIDFDQLPASHQLLALTQSGSIGLITPLTEHSYRRLSTLQTQIGNVVEQFCGLNPRAYRAVESDGIGGRGMLDGTLLQRFYELSSQRRADISSRVGAAVWDLYADLDAIGGVGLTHV